MWELGFVKYEILGNFKWCKSNNGLAPTVHKSREILTEIRMNLHNAKQKMQMTDPQCCMCAEIAAPPQHKCNMIDDWQVCERQTSASMSVTKFCSHLLHAITPICPQNLAENVKAFV